MSADWPSLKISNIAYFRNNKRIPLKSLDRAKRQGIYPYYGASGVVDYIDDYIFDGTYLLISEDGENLRSRKTPIAFKAHGKFWVNNHAHILEEKEEGVLDYLEYYLSQLDLTPYITGAVQPKLNKANLESIEIPVPPIEERRAINGMLNALTNKINLNHQINQTLEQMAQAIFKSWFVDFEPVKAKIAALEAGGSEEDALFAAMQAISGKSANELARLKAENPEQYAELRSTAELFPSAMQESELGEIPEGWSVPCFEDIAVAKQGKYLAKDKMSPTISPDSIVPVWGGNGVLGYTNSCSYPSPVVLMTCRGSNCGLIRHTESEAWVSNNAFACSPRIGSVWFLFTYFNASSFDDCISGSAQPQITYSALRSKSLAIPVHEETCKRYSAFIQAMFDQIIHLRNEARSLESLRDTLLPKLLTGELSVGAAEEQIEETVEA